MKFARDPRGTTPYRDRRDAGAVLARNLTHHHGQALIVLALPRGGLPVADEVARALDAPLDVFVVRKLGVPGHEELAMGAIASGGVRVLNDDVIAWYRLPPSAIDEVARGEALELERRESLYREGRALLLTSRRIPLPKSAVPPRGHQRRSIRTERQRGRAIRLSDPREQLPSGRSFPDAHISIGAQGDKLLPVGRVPDREHAAVMTETPGAQPRRHLRRDGIPERIRRLLSQQRHDRELDERHAST